MHIACRRIPTFALAALLMVGCSTRPPSSGATDQDTNQPNLLVDLSNETDAAALRDLGGTDSANGEVAEAVETCEVDGVTPLDDLFDNPETFLGQDIWLEATVSATAPECGSMVFAAPPGNPCTVCSGRLALRRGDEVLPLASDLLDTRCAGDVGVRSFCEPFQWTCSSGWLGEHHTFAVRPYREASGDIALEVTEDCGTVNVGSPDVNHLIWDSTREGEDFLGPRLVYSDGQLTGYRDFPANTDDVEEPGPAFNINLSPAAQSEFESRLQRGQASSPPVSGTPALPVCRTSYWTWSCEGGQCDEVALAFHYGDGTPNSSWDAVGEWLDLVVRPFEVDVTPSAGCQP
ncbi:MAG: hypothetical protein KC561_02990 [Myxococcales bacterium]|nr:hypothetical protein [Myxococcales bacterium]